MNTSDALLLGTSDVNTRIGKADERVVREQRRCAARAVAGNFARDVADCALLLDMLGLDPQEAR